MALIVSSKLFVFISLLIFLSLVRVVFLFGLMLFSVRAASPFPQRLL